MGKEFDEETAAKAVAELAPARDFDLVADIFDAAAMVRTTWETFRVGPSYPPKSSPIRGVTDSRGTSVAKMVAALPTVAPDDVAAAQRAVAPVLGDFFPRSTPAEAGVGDAVEKLRYVAMTRPQLVRDARTISRRRRT